MTPGLRVTIAPATLHAEFVHKGVICWADDFTWDSAEDLRAVMPKVAAAAPRQHSSTGVLVELDPALVQQRSLTDLPPVNDQALHAIVARGTSRFFRQNGHRLVSDAAWAPGREGQPRIALAIAVDGPLVEAILAGSLDARLEVKDIVPAGGLPALSLLPGEERARRERRAWTRSTLLALVALAVWIVVLGVVAGRRWLDLRETEQELARLQEPRAALQAARIAMESASAMVEATDRARTQRQDVVRVLTWVTQSLPDSAYLDEIVVNARGSGSISGRAKQPGAVLRRLERNGAVPGATMQVAAQPVEGDPAQGWTGFVIRFGEAVVP